MFKSKVKVFQDRLGPHAEILFLGRVFREIKQPIAGKERWLTKSNPRVDAVESDWCWPAAEETGAEFIRAVDEQNAEMISALDHFFPPEPPPPPMTRAEKKARTAELNNTIRQLRKFGWRVPDDEKDF